MILFSVVLVGIASGLWESSLVDDMHCWSCVLTNERFMLLNDRLGPFTIHKFSMPFSVRLLLQAPPGLIEP